MSREELWPTLDEAALHGLAGEVVETIEPHTEADPAGLLSSFVTGFGNAAGRGPHLRVGAACHRGNLCVANVGATARARKGTAWTETHAFLERAEPQWSDQRIVGGFGSGEAIIDLVQDPMQPRPGVEAL